MPMYNSERFLRASIESVISQTYRNWELLVIDDFSTDNSYQIAKEYAVKDSRIRVIRNTVKKGMPSAPRNIGVQAARGRFIAFLDSDDLWFPQKLEQQLALFKDNRTAIVYSNYEKMDEKGLRSNRIVTAPAHVTYRTLLFGNIIGNLTGIYDSKKVGKVPIKDIHHEDYVMWLQILKQGYIAKNTDTTLAAYRVSSSSVSADKLIAIKWQWNIYRNIEHLSLLRSALYFSSYAIKALLKSII